MKTRKHRVPLLSGGSRSLLAALVAGVAVEAGAASIGSSFSYQGRLTVDGRPADGHFDLTFVLRDSATRGNQVAGPLTNADVSVSQGLFTTALDFGLDAFEGSPR